MEYFLEPKEAVNKPEAMEASMETSRKRQLLNDSETTLQAKVSRETDKIIHMQVKSEAVEWELTNKVENMKNSIERLQQNLRSQRMEYESLNTSFENELRYRESILNKMETTRSMCTLVEQHAKTVFDTLATCEKDRQTISSVYEKAVSSINEMRADIKTVQHNHQPKIAAYQKRIDEDNKRLKQLSKINEQLNGQITTVNTSNIELTTFNSELKASIDLKNEELRQTQSKLKLITEDSARQLEMMSREIKEKDQLCSRMESEMMQGQSNLTDVNGLYQNLSEENKMVKENLATVYNQLTIQQHNNLEQKENSLAREEKLSSIIDALNEECRVLKEKLLKSAEKSENVNSENVSMKKEIEEKQEIYKLKSEEMEENYKLKVKTLENTVEAITRENESFKQKLTQLEDEKKTAEESLDSLKSNMTTLMAELKSGTAEKTKLEMKLEQITKEQDILRDMHAQKMELAENSTNIWVKETEHVKKQLNLKMNQNMELHQKYHNLQKELEALKSMSLNRGKPGNSTPQVGSSTGEGRPVSSVLSKIVEQTSTGEKERPIIWRSPFSQRVMTANKAEHERKIKQNDLFFTDESSLDGFTFLDNIDDHLGKAKYPQVDSSQEQKTKTITEKGKRKKQRQSVNDKNKNQDKADKM